MTKLPWPIKCLESLPAHWRDWIGMRCRSRNQASVELVATDFPSGSWVKLQFDDGSVCIFEHAICAVDQTRNEVAVFTEHIGYHIFPLDGLRYSAQPKVEVCAGAAV